MIGVDEVQGRAGALGRPPRGTRPPRRRADMLFPGIRCIANAGPAIGRHHLCRCLGRVCRRGPARFPCRGAPTFEGQPSQKLRADDGVLFHPGPGARQAGALWSSARITRLLAARSAPDRRCRPKPRDARRQTRLPGQPAPRPLAGPILPLGGVLCRHRPIARRPPAPAPSRGRRALRHGRWSRANRWAPPRRPAPMISSGRRREGRARTGPRAKLPVAFPPHRMETVCGTWRPPRRPAKKSFALSNRVRRRYGSFFGFGKRTAPNRRRCAPPVRPRPAGQRSDGVGLGTGLFLCGDAAFVSGPGIFAEIRNPKLANTKFRVRALRAAPGMTS